MLNKQQVSIISTVANGAMGIAKVVTGLAANSSALMAEGLHSSIDFVSSGITYLGIRVADKKATETHPYGWGRAEVLASLVVVVLHAASIGALSFVVMVASVTVNELMGRLKIRVGREEESLALIADGKHSRVDVYSSGAALVGIGLARFLPVLDSVTAVGVGLYILYEALELGKEVGENLLDVADLEAEKEIKEICAEEQIEVENIRTRKIGSRTSAEVEIAVPGEVKVGRVDDLIRDLQEKLIKEITRLEYIVVQITGGGKRSRMFREECKEDGVERIGPEKKGRRVITPYRTGEPYEDFGAPEYMVVDYENGKEVQREIIKNPYFKIGRGHGVQFSQAVQADEVQVKDIGENARQALDKLGIMVT